MNNFVVDSLSNLALDKLCNSINEKSLQYILKSYPPQIIWNIIKKILNINADSNEFVYNKVNSDGEKYSVIRGRELARMALCYPDNIARDDACFTVVQTIFEDKFNFCIYFDYILFLKLVSNGDRSKLFTIFQICVEKNGFTFPIEFAEKWINSEKKIQDDSNNIFHHIKHGLKIGIFLGDAGWLNESAIVLSYTFKIISTSWVCPDQNLKLSKIIQCLSKWLLVTSNYHNFDEAKYVLGQILNTINIIKNMKDKSLCIASAYVSISQYYYILMEFNEAWSWALKAVNELHDKGERSVILKLLVIGHAIRVCSVLNKLSIAKKLILQLHTCNEEIEQNIHVDMLMNEAFYLLKADLAEDSISSYYTALDSRRNLFGYYNLHTAIVFVEFAYSLYICNSSATRFCDAMGSVLQGIYIMNRIGLLNDNMLLINASQIKAMILKEYAETLIDYELSNGGMTQVLEDSISRILREAESLCLKALNSYLITVGEKAPITARSYFYLGRVYQCQEKFTESELMYLKSIEINESILGKDSPEVAFSICNIANLYMYQLEYEEAEQLYLRSKIVYETTNGHQNAGLLDVFEGLSNLYSRLEKIEQYNQCMSNLIMFQETRKAWLDQVHRSDDENCKRADLSLEKLKCILNDCNCEST